MLIAVQRFQLERIVLGQRRQLLVILVILCAVLRFNIQLGKALEFDAVEANSTAENNRQCGMAIRCVKE